MHLHGSPPKEVEWTMTKEQFESIVRQMSLEIQRLNEELQRQSTEETLNVLKGAFMCPFCGLPPNEIQDEMTAADGFTSGWAVLCQNDGCGACGPVKRRGKKTAIEAWNTRKGK